MFLDQIPFLFGAFAALSVSEQVIYPASITQRRLPPPTPFFSNPSHLLDLSAEGRSEAGSAGLKPHFEGGSTFQK